MHLLWYLVQLFDERWVLVRFNMLLYCIGRFGTAVRCAMHTVHAVFFQFERRRDSSGSGSGGRIAGDHYLHNAAVGSTHLQLGKLT